MNPPTPSKEERPPQWGTNTGHGHVWPRPDGVKARCGGPGLCAQCSQQAAQYVKPQSNSIPSPSVDDELRQGLRLIFFPSPTPTFAEPEVSLMLDKAMSLLTSHRLSHEAEVRKRLEGWKEDNTYCTYEEEQGSRYWPICKWCGKTEHSSAHAVAGLLDALGLTSPPKKEQQQ